MLFREVLLTKAERRVIKRITKIRMDNLSQILVGDTFEDVIMMCIEEDICYDDFLMKIREELLVQETIFSDPGLLFSKDWDTICTAKHIMFNCANAPKYAIGRRRIWKKFLLLERFPINLN